MTAVDECEERVLSFPELLQIFDATQKLLCWRGKKRSKLGFAHCMDDRHLDCSVYQYLCKFNLIVALSIETMVLTRSKRSNAGKAPARLDEAVLSAPPPSAQPKKPI
jgi:hypothetical protein